MKKIIATIIVAALVLAIAMPALAGATIMYPKKNGVKAYAKKDTDSKVLRKLSKGDKLLIEKKSGKWYAILVEDTKHGGQKLAWIQGKNLYTEKEWKKEKEKEKKEKKKSKATPKPTANPQKEIDRVLESMRAVEPYAAEVSTVTENGTVALRLQPTVNGKRITDLPNGHRLTVLAEGDDWYQVRDDASETIGFMSSKFIIARETGAEEETGEEAETEAETETEEETEAETEAQGRVIEPVYAPIDPEAIEDGEYPASFNPADISTEDGIVLNGVQLYTEDWYDIVDISTLQAGDSIVVADETIAVTSVSRGDNGIVMINGGLDEGGIELVSEEDTNGFHVQGYDDMSSYTERAKVTLKLAEDATFNDGWDIEKEPETFAYGEIVAAIANSGNDDFYADNTTIRVEGGLVREIKRVYVP